MKTNLPFVLLDFLEEVVEEKPHVKPYFTKTILDIEVVEGSAARFDCKIEGTLNEHVSSFLFSPYSAISVPPACLFAVVLFSFTNICALQCDFLKYVFIFAIVEYILSSLAIFCACHAEETGYYSAALH